MVFGELGTADLTGKAILSTLNSEINAINAKVTERFPGQVKLSNAALAFATGLNLQTLLDLGFLQALPACITNLLHALICNAFPT